MVDISRTSYVSPSVSPGGYSGSAGLRAYALELDSQVIQNVGAENIFYFGSFRSNTLIFGMKVGSTKTNLLGTSTTIDCTFGTILRSRFDGTYSSETDWVGPVNLLAGGITASTQPNPNAVETTIGDFDDNLYERVLFADIRSYDGTILENPKAVVQVEVAHFERDLY
jgi:hypothetical protein